MANGSQSAPSLRKQMTPAEILREIERAAGPVKGLRELREDLPTALTGHRPRPEMLDFEPEVFSAAEATSKAVPPGPAPLTPAQRETVIDQALVILQDIYAHLPLKRALHAIDPIQRLRLLRMRHEALDERSFQTEMIDIFTGLRDLHTNYTLPSAYWPKFAFLPFRVEEYYENGKNGPRKYLVSWVSPINPQSDLVRGAEITHWNGAPIDLAVMRNAAREAGSNPDARRARGLEALTLRWLGASVPPDEDWVTLTYSVNGTVKESRFFWQVVERNDLPELLAGAPDSAEVSTDLGLDVKTELLRRVRKILFDAPAIQIEREMAEHRESASPAPEVTAGVDNVSVMPDVYPKFGSVTTPSGTFGYVRLATFSPPKNVTVDSVVNEFVRILRTLPPDGLILDVRGNGGGDIRFGERILQTLTPHPVTPEPFHLATTALTIRLAQSVQFLGQWAESLRTALATGAGFSQGFPITDPKTCNAIGQIYQGPVVLVTDAFCYSTTDIFAAGFQDHGIGTILGCHDNTGAGGANVWDHETVLQKLGMSMLFPPLPLGTGMRVAARRSTRVGTQSGVPLEDLGVVPDERYYMTRNDLLRQNVDLIARAGAILKDQLKQTLALEPDGTTPLSGLNVLSSGIDRVDLLVDGRPVVSSDITASPAQIRFPKPVAVGSKVTALGFRKGDLVVSTRYKV